MMQLHNMGFTCQRDESIFRLESRNKKGKALEKLPEIV
jgi:hypothetical protein